MATSERARSPAAPTPGAIGRAAIAPAGGTSESAAPPPIARTLVEMPPRPTLAGAGADAGGRSIVAAGAFAGGAGRAGTAACRDPARIVTATCGLGSREGTGAIAGRVARVGGATA